jgi:glycosyltransferase involved in cell wall biosynthesis
MNTLSRSIKIPPALSIIVPCYNEQDVLPETFNRIYEKLEHLISQSCVSRDSDIVFVDDGSSDKTWNLIEGFAESTSCIKGVKLSRNCGHQNALMAGLMSAKGDILVSIDADLQDDVDAIDQMIEKYNQGCEIVYGVRSMRTSDTAFKRGTAELFYSLLNKMGVDLIFNHADYRLLSRKAVEALKDFTEVNLFLRGIVPLLGFKSATVYYERIQRMSGTSKYPIGKMLALAIAGITSFSNVPIRTITALGFLTAMIAFAMLFWVLIVKLCTDDAVPGWASIMIPLFFLSGVQLFCLGVLGEYVAKIYSETKRRPRYLIEKTIL